MDLSTAQLILDMRKMHIDGAGNQQLSARGTEIYERLEKDSALAGNDVRKQGVINAERAAFEKILASIRNGRGPNALAEYDKHVARRLAHLRKNAKKLKKTTNPMSRVR